MQTLPEHRLRRGRYQLDLDINARQILGDNPCSLMTGVFR